MYKQQSASKSPRAIAGIPAPVIATLINLTHKAELQRTSYYVNVLQTIVNIYMQTDSRPPYEDFYSVCTHLLQFYVTYDLSSSYMILRSKLTDMTGLDTYEVLYNQSKDCLENFSYY